MQPDPGKGGAQSRGGVVQVGGPRQGEEAGPIKCSRPQGRCCLAERVLRRLGVDRCLRLQVPEPPRRVRASVYLAALPASAPVPANSRQVSEAVASGDAAGAEGPAAPRPGLRSAGHVGPELR